MMDELEFVDAVRAFEELQEMGEEMYGLLQRYESIDELVEEEGERIDQIMDNSEENELVQYVNEINVEIESAYKSADWT